MFVVSIWRRNQFERLRGSVVKECGLFFFHLLLTVLVGVFSCVHTFIDISFQNEPCSLEVIQHSEIWIIFSVCVLGTFPVIHFVYSFPKSSNQLDLRDHEQVANLSSRDLRTTRRQTVPLSTRVSPQTNTATDLPNFQSQSKTEPTVVTPLLS